MSNLTLIFKPTYSCNLRCKYCYAECQRDGDSKLITFDEVKVAFSWIVEYCKAHNYQQVNVLWHGGEPLLTGSELMTQIIEFYNDLFNSNNIKCKSSIQTNLLLLNQRFIPIFKKYFRSQVSFSYDYNSSDRLYPNGKDASPDIVAKMEYALANEIDLCCVSLLGSNNLNNIPEIYNFFKNHNISFKLNRIFVPDVATASSLECVNSISNEDYIKAMCQLLDIWLQDPHPNITVVNLAEMIVAYLSNCGTVCHLNENCGENFISIGPKGVIMPCGTFESSVYQIGNYYNDEPSKVYDRRMAITNQGITLQELGCNSCRYLSICHGGCPQARISGWQKDTCITSKGIWNYIDIQMKKMGLSQGCMENISPDVIKKWFNGANDGRN